MVFKEKSPSIMYNDDVVEFYNKHAKGHIKNHMNLRDVNIMFDEFEVSTKDFYQTNFHDVYGLFWDYYGYIQRRKGFKLQYYETDQVKMIPKKVFPWLYMQYIKYKESKRPL